MDSARDDLQVYAEKVSSLVDDISDSILARRDGLVVVIEVYMDESGTHYGSQNVSVSAVWAEKSAWTDWTLDWVKAKAPVRIYHAVDCHNRVGEYAGWSKEVRDEHVMRVLPVIRNHHIEGHFAALDKRNLFKALEKRVGPIPTEMNALLQEGMYLVCFFWALKGAWSYLISRGHENIAFFCESNSYSSGMSSSFDYLKDFFPEGSAQFAIGSKLKYIPLQCADILAFEGNRQMRKTNFLGDRRKPLQAIDPIGNRFGFIKRSADEIDGMADFMVERWKRMAAAEGR